MDAELILLWSAKPEDKFRTQSMDWTNGKVGDCLNIYDLKTGEKYAAPIDELSFEDPTVPDFFAALRILRDFKRHEMQQFRGGRSYLDMADLVVELDTLGSSERYSNPADRSNYLRRQRWEQVSNNGLALDLVPLADRDVKMCELAVQQNFRAHEHVPVTVRTDEFEAFSLACKKEQKAKDEAEAAAKTAAAEAEAEAKKAKRRAADKVRRDARKAAKVAEARAQSLELPPPPVGTPILCPELPDDLMGYDLLLGDKTNCQWVWGTVVDHTASFTKYIRVRCDVKMFGPDSESFLGVIERSEIRNIRETPTEVAVRVAL